jgi:hypothetical protein
MQKSTRAGSWKVLKRLKLKGYVFNHKRVYRVYCRLGLNLPRRTKRVLPKRPLVPLAVGKKEHAACMNHSRFAEFARLGSTFPAQTQYRGSAIQIVFLVVWKAMPVGRGDGRVLLVVAVDRAGRAAPDCRTL